MGVLVIAGATSLAIAAGIASVIGETEREPMVPAEPDVVRAPLPEDPVDRAKLLAARGLAADHSRSAEDVVVRHADSGSSEHDPIRIAALVDARVGAAVIRTVPVPLVLAAFLALVPDERARTRPARDADRGRRRKARTRRRGRAVRQVAVRMKPVGDGELLEAPAATALHEHAGGAAGDPDVAVLVSGRSHHVPGRGRQSVAGEMPAVTVRDHDHVAGVPWTRVWASVRSAVDAAVAGIRWPRVHAGVDACVDSSVCRRDDVLRSATAAAAGDCHCNRCRRAGRRNEPTHAMAPCRSRRRPCSRRLPGIRPACAGWRRRPGRPGERWPPAHWRASCRTSRPGTSRSRNSRPLWRP